MNILDLTDPVWQMNSASLNMMFQNWRKYNFVLKAYNFKAITLEHICSP